MKSSFDKTNLSMRILILDDHLIFAQSFKLLLEKELGYSTIEVLSTTEEVRKKLEEGTVDLIFTDFLMPDLNMLEEIKEWKTLNDLAYIVVISGIINTSLIALLLKNNVDAFLSKSSDMEEVSVCLKEILEGRLYITRELQQKVMKELIHTRENLFTPRENEIIHLIRQGKSIKETASILELSENTVIVHRRNIMHKAKVKSVVELLSKIDDYII